ncbi:hypothetical protein WCD74_10905 [Actinomycetospora sp. OC33-EN08]|uniref:Uncharacterized protein n=1 Tax=Actinomycetospora aurantiaca TaxID=3129233 RepID=A0ABU8MLV1_9PSEU
MAESGFDPKGWAPAEPFTVHADTDRTADRTGTDAAAGPPARRRLDVFTLLVGLVCVAVAVFAMAAPALLVAADPRWVLAGAAIVIGGGALLAGARRVGGRRAPG